MKLDDLLKPAPVTAYLVRGGGRIKLPNEPIKLSKPDTQSLVQFQATAWCQSKAKRSAKFDGQTLALFFSDGKVAGHIYVDPVLQGLEEDA